MIWVRLTLTYLNITKTTERTLKRITFLESLSNVWYENYKIFENNFKKMLVYDKYDLTKLIRLI